MSNNNNNVQTKWKKKENSLNDSEATLIYSNFTLFTLGIRTKFCLIIMWKTRKFVKWLRCIGKFQQFHIILGYDEARIYRRIRGNRRSPWRQNCCQFDRSFEQSRYHLPQIWCRYQRHWEVDQQPFAFSSIRVSLWYRVFRQSYAVKKMKLNNFWKKITSLNNSDPINARQTAKS